MPVNYQFDEILLDPNLFTLGDAFGSPEFANAMGRAPGTGVMKINVTRQDAQHVWTVDFKMVKPSEGGGSSNEMDYFNHMWYGGFGSAYGFRVRVETDRLANNEVLGTSDGTVTSKTWKLTKKYQRPGTTTHPYYRYICKPVVSTNLGGSSVTLYEPNGTTPRVIESPFVLMENGTPVPSGWTVDNTKGIITYASAPAAGKIISWSGAFDIPMRFFTNAFQQKHDFPAEIKGLQLIEILPAELGL